MDFYKLSKTVLFRGNAGRNRADVVLLKGGQTQI